ncbi:MAG TPA: XRE family transcriptional regulator [Proteiniclasticum sp.]|uniref:Helix-turn-helix n=1 Tax=Proteiniclasticum ruminis TaxID=398199 RepID=A0A1I5AH63_9CLOT|nr:MULTISPECIES: helix-turn-helix transcriptional regulator [Proteiniclasticum]SFN61710.1 Helix-turn-helix [Proteiniclasticum ruminis]HBW13121.1 XRE family transcriptional regulator [Proteiniclasticum sp.]
MVTIGDNIRKYRKKKNLTQKELGDIVGISNTYLSDMEIGRTNPSIKTLKRIAKGLEISYVDLLKDTEE